METELWKQSYRLAKQPFCYGSHHFWVMSYENWELSCGNTLSKQALDFSQVMEDKSDMLIKWALDKACGLDHGAVHPTGCW